MSCLKTRPKETELSFPPTSAVTYTSSSPKGHADHHPHWVEVRERSKDIKHSNSQLLGNLFTYLSTSPYFDPFLHLWYGKGPRMVNEILNISIKNYDLLYEGYSHILFCTWYLLTLPLRRHWGRKNSSQIFPYSSSWYYSLNQHFSQNNQY